MSKAEKLKERFGKSIRESLGAGEGTSPTLVEHPARNKRFEGTTRATGFRNIPLIEIEADPQHREEFDEEELRLLADSLNADGLLAPIIVRWDGQREKYIIIAGERRYRAAKLCGWNDMTCDIKPDDISEGEVAEIQLAENHARKNLNPIELARAFKDVLEKNGYTVRDLAKRVGVNETTVTRYVRLLGLPHDVQKEIASGGIPIGIAREAARLDGEQKQREFIQKVINEGYSANEAQRVASGKRWPRKSKSSKSFSSEFGDVIVNPKCVSKPNYDYCSEMLKLALEEVNHRIRNKVAF